MTESNLTPIATDAEMRLLRRLEAIDREINEAREVARQDAAAHRDAIKALEELRDGQLSAIEQSRLGARNLFEEVDDDNP